VNRLLAIESSQQARIDALEAQLAEVRRSRTWKMTNALKEARAWFLQAGRSAN